MHLKQLHARNQLLSFFAILAILLILTFILWRYRLSQKRTKELVKRIDDAMQMQISQIETAVTTNSRHNLRRYPNLIKGVEISRLS